MKSLLTHKEQFMSKLQFNIRWTPTMRQRALAFVTAPILVLSLALGGLYTHSASAQPARSASPLASSLDAGFAVDWIQQVYDLVKAETVNAPAASRVYAYS